MNTIKTILTLIIALTLLASCAGMKKKNSPPKGKNIISETAQKFGINQVVGISFKGKPFVFDTEFKSQTPIESCKKRRDSNNPCSVKVKFNKDKPYLVQVDSTGQETIIKSDPITIYHFSYPGSHCEMKVINTTGYEDCKSWEVYKHFLKSIGR